MCVLFGTCRIGSDLLAMDRYNLTGSYNLNLGRPLDHAMAQRMQRAALQESAWEANR